jgi:hypothetical protein
MNSFKEMYKELHNKQTYDIPSLTKEDCRFILGLVVGTDSHTILDFGGGKGLQYSEEFHMYRDFRIKKENISIYDIGIPGKDIMPEEEFDGVISTDVLEHIPEKELDKALDLLFSKASKFVYIAVFCGPAKTLLPNGENAHCTIKPPKWWKRKVESKNIRDLPLIITYRLPVD